MVLALSVLPFSCLSSLHLFFFFTLSSCCPSSRPFSTLSLLLHLVPPLLPLPGLCQSGDILCLSSCLPMLCVSLVYCTFLSLRVAAISWALRWCGTRIACSKAVQNGKENNWGQHLRCHPLHRVGRVVAGRPSIPLERPFFLWKLSSLAPPRCSSRLQLQNSCSFRWEDVAGG